MPNVTLYLDDQSMAFPGQQRRLLVDIASRSGGPTRHSPRQGSQAGLVRYITNKPKLDKTEGDVNATYGDLRR
jgi:hypothetical protein